MGGEALIIIEQQVLVQSQKNYICRLVRRSMQIGSFFNLCGSAGEPLFLWQKKH